MKHPETDYCTGCDVEVRQLKAALIHLLGDRQDGHDHLKVTIPYWLIDMASTYKLRTTCNAEGVTFEIMVTHHMGS